MRNLGIRIFYLLIIVLHSEVVFLQDLPATDLVFDQLSKSWDEAIPLGNGIIGNLVWEKEGKLRFSLDRADLWDLRPMENIDFEKWSFHDVYDHWRRDEYDLVQAAFDAPYESLSAPSKIPAGALEFDLNSIGEVVSVALSVATGLCTVKWKNGTVLRTFVHATSPSGWYEFTNLNGSPDIVLMPPAYDRPSSEGPTSQSKNDLVKLGYEPGRVVHEENTIHYHQDGWESFSYQIYTAWEQSKNTLTGCWSISSQKDGWRVSATAKDVVDSEMTKSFRNVFETHKAWWKAYWEKSAISIPDSLLQLHYELEMYKFGSVARAEAPPISLQAVWTADHGKLPPWKGDFHHDLNTQLSYWPAYIGNHLDLEMGFINWLWKHRETFKKYTQDYFRVGGMNVPGVTTLEGAPMGGWIQYSFGQTVGAWLAHHFYLHWDFTRDQDFLRERAYPWLKDVAIFFEEISVLENGIRKLKMSSSPEIFNNSRGAWFEETTNFDLSLIRWTLEKTSELAVLLALDEDAQRWQQQLSQWPELAVDASTGLMVAPGFPYNQSHRHFSHLMAIHPLNLVGASGDIKEQAIVDVTIAQLEKMGTDYWTGYSYSWLANLYARNFQAEKAVETLHIFAQCFCLKNSFHANGDQCKDGHSTMIYRPFTLEGNFAFAAAVQEMLLQSHAGWVQIFPAVPDDWKDIKFNRLRVRGGFLVSATQDNGQLKSVRIESTVGGRMQIQNPFGHSSFSCNRRYMIEGDRFLFETEVGEVIQFLSQE